MISLERCWPWPGLEKKNETSHKMENREEESWSKVREAKERTLAKRECKRGMMKRDSIRETVEVT